MYMFGRDPSEIWDRLERIFRNQVSSGQDT